jgi:hypothetical protein
MIDKRARSPYAGRHRSLEFTLAGEAKSKEVYAFLLSQHWGRVVAPVEATQG